MQVKIHSPPGKQKLLKIGLKMSDHILEITEDQTINMSENPEIITKDQNVHQGAYIGSPTITSITLALCSRV